MGTQKKSRQLLAAGLIIFILAWSASLTARAESDPLEGAGKVYYVSPNGCDLDLGSKTQPWLTIGKAAATLSAGDTVYIRNGTYSERVEPKNSGAAGSYIAYRAYPGHSPIIDGTGVWVPGWGGLFDMSDADYIRVSGLQVVNSASAGIFADRSSYIIIEDNYTYNTVSSGIGVWSSDHAIIDGNEVVLACNDGEQEDISVGGTDVFEVRYNHVHHGGPGTRGGEGIDAKDGSSNGKVYGNHVHDLPRIGIYVDAWNKHTYNIEVFQNVVHDVASFAYAVSSEKGGLLENIRVYNNIAYHNQFVGIGITNWDQRLSDEHPMRDIYVLNNTFYDNGWDEWGGCIDVENPEVQNLVIRNNICSQNLSFQIILEAGVSAANLTVDHNLIDGYRGYEGEIYGDDYVEGAARFMNPAGANFQLQKRSPAVDAGSDLDAPFDDFDGRSRPQDGDRDGHPHIDIGAYERPFYSEVYLPILFKD